VKKRITIGLLIGIVAGVIDVIPMLIQKLTWDANLSAFSFWVVSGFMIATSSLKLNPLLKGILIAFLCLLPTLFIIGWQEPISLLPILVMTVILGALVGFILNKIVRD
jgi:drug/metabolite transporter (DMT)-like permease